MQYCLFIYNLNRVQSMNTNQNDKQLHISHKVPQLTPNQHLSACSHLYRIQSQPKFNGKSLQPKQKNTQNSQQLHKIKDQHTQQSGKSQIGWRSSKHNFQKHTVVTIKKLASRLTGQFDVSPSEVVANQMWNIFLSSVILFGSADLNSQKYKDLLKSSFFGEICNYEQELVRRAQNILRNKVLQYLTEDLVRVSILSNRHISQKWEFLAYFCEFVAMLREGPLVKFRINSRISKHIDDRIRTAETLQEERRRTIKRTVDIN